MSGPTPLVSVVELLAALRSGATTPSELAAAFDVAATARGDDGTWITRVDRAALLARAAELEADPAARDLPLYGIPYAVKDSIHVAGLPTTLACPAYATVPTEHAEVVRRLEAAGAICVGKTNLDQFATGLNGTRTPYTVPRSVFGGDLMSGGSSSGSALAVALGQVPFAVATDTAGSGRVPAAMNGLLGYKPSRGLISAIGLVPACRSLDCVTLMATTVADLRLVMDVVAAEPDERDPWARPRRRAAVGRPRIGLPSPVGLPFGHAGADDPDLRTAHAAATGVLAGLGEVRDVDVEPFLAAGRLLYAGPWVAERTLEFGDFLLDHRADVLPVIAEIIGAGDRFSAIDAFAAQYELAALQAATRRLFRDVDVVVLPTVPTTFTVAEVRADPVATNTTLGTYTQSGNLLDLCGIVVPAGVDGRGRPVGLMLLAPALGDDTVLELAERLGAALAAAPAPSGDRTTFESSRGPHDSSNVVRAGGERALLAVAGHHLRGEARNAELTDRGGELVTATTTAAAYRLLKVGADPGVPALLADGESAIEVEVWSLPAAHLDAVVAGMPPVLTLGRVVLAGGHEVPGMVCAPAVASRADTDPAITDITAAGGWRGHRRATALTR